MITKKNFDDIKYFEPEEFEDPDHFGSWTMLNRQVLVAIDKLRELMDAPIIIHSAVCIDGLCGHTAGSFHLVCNGCKAIDFHVDTTTMSIRKQYQIIESMCVVPYLTFQGIGVYHDWVHPGFHVDMGNRFQRWVRKDGLYTYLLP